MLNIEEIVKATRGKIINGDSKYIPQNYVIDSREVVDGDFFVPIVGENTDGHKYIINSVKQGASAFFINKEYKEKEKIIEEAKEINKNIGIIEVEDTKKALYAAGKYNRQKHINIPVIAVTGSVGKTSTREIIASVLKTEKNVLVTKKNYNSYIGIPIMTLKMDSQDICVFEAGIDFFGEMELESDLLKPDVAVITMIGTAHISTFKTQDKIFEEKLKITNNLKGLKKLVVNNDDKFLTTLRKNDEYEIIKYSRNDVRDIEKKVESINFKTNIYDDSHEVCINQIGDHNILNSLCAIKIGEIFGIKTDNIIKGIAEYRNFPRRLEIKKIQKDIIIIDDTYNASIDSMKSGLMTINELRAKRKIAVLGDMLELGDLSQELHLQLGEYFSKVKYDVLITIGKETEKTHYMAKKYFKEDEIFHYESNEDALEKIKEILKPGDLVYFKASNGMKFDYIIDKLQNK